VWCGFEGDPKVDRAGEKGERRRRMFPIIVDSDDHRSGRLGVGLPERERRGLMEFQDKTIKGIDGTRGWEWKGMKEKRPSEL
jgi:hypothetical protein